MSAKTNPAPKNLPPLPPLSPVSPRDSGRAGKGKTEALQSKISPMNPPKSNKSFKAKHSKWDAFWSGMFKAFRKTDKTDKSVAPTAAVMPVRRPVSSIIEQPCIPISSLDQVMTLSARLNAVKPPVSPAAASSNKRQIIYKGNDPVLIKNNCFLLRKEARADLQELAVQFSPKNKVNEIVPKGQINLGNTCYMNAALQCLETSYTFLDKDCQRLLDCDLSRLQGESLEDLEARLLKQWSPIENISNRDREPINNRIEELNQRIAALSPDALQEKRKLTQEREFCRLEVKRIDNWDPEEYQDKLLFKWSYLLLLQAKKHGNEAQINKALKAHHSIVFMIDRSPDLNDFTGLGPRTMQHDSDVYFKLWHDMLEKGFEISSIRFATVSNKIIESDVRMEPAVPTLSLALGFGNFKQGLENNFFKVNENSERLNNLKEQKEGKEQELDAMTVTANKPLIINLAKEIALLDFKITQNRGDALTRFKKTKTEKLAALEKLGHASKKDLIRLTKEIVSIEIEIEDLPYWTPESESLHDFTEHSYFAKAPPEVICIQLKRFGMDNTPNGSVDKKIDAKIPFKKDAKNEDYAKPLDLKECFLPENLDDSGARYELTGFVEHIGGGNNSGHYISYVLRGNDWCCCNDGTVTKKNISAVPFEKAYMMTYRKLSS